MPDPLKYPVNTLPITVAFGTVATLPTDVTSPVKLALVVTDPAVVAVAAFPPILKLATGVVEVTTNGAVPMATVEVSGPETDKLVPVAAPIFGIVSIGEADNTTFPVPVAVVTPVPPLRTGKVPVTPVVNGNPVMFVATPEAGVPKFGVINVGELAKTTAPVPVDPDELVGIAIQLPLK